MFIQSPMEEQDGGGISWMPLFLPGLTGVNQSTVQEPYTQEKYAGVQVESTNMY